MVVDSQLYLTLGAQVDSKFTLFEVKSSSTGTIDDIQASTSYSSEGRPYAVILGSSSNVLYVGGYLKLSYRGSSAYYMSISRIYKP